METRKLLIADSNEEFRLALAQALQTQFYVRCCATGTQALSLLRQDPPDILVLDLLLPELDGLTLLEQIVAEGIRPMVLATTTIPTDYISQCAVRLGIGYLMLKSCPIQAVTARVRDLNTHLVPPPQKPDLEELIRKKLHFLNISDKYLGYDYLFPALELLAKDPKQSFTKELYPDVAKRFGCTSRSVERCIRNAIEKAWEHRDPAAWSHYFPQCTERPSNALFLSTLAKELRQEMEY